MPPGEPGARPPVPGAVREAGAVWLLASVQFVVAMIVTQFGWSAAHPYSLKNNYISDLGNTACGYFPAGSTTYVCSPWHVVFNGSVTFLGLLVIYGAVLVPRAFLASRLREVGLALTVLAGVGAAGVGVFPENLYASVHSSASALAFVAGGLALLLLGATMVSDRRWDGGYRPLSFALGAVTLVATALFLAGVDGGLGVGGMERLIVAPLLLWLVVVPLHLLRLRAFAPRTGPRGSGS